MNSQNPKPKFRCGVSTWLLSCQYDKKGLCTFEAGKGVKCTSQHQLPSLFCPVSPEQNADVRHAIEREQDLEAFGLWDCKCGHQNTTPHDTITLFCSKCGKPRKFDLIEKEP